MCGSNCSTSLICQPICRTPLHFLPQCGTKGVVRFHSSFSKLHSTIIFLPFTMIGSAFFVLLLVVVLLSLLTTVVVFVLSNTLLINPCVVLGSLYLLIPSLINLYKYKVLICRKYLRLQLGSPYQIVLAQLSYFPLLLSSPLLKSRIMWI